MKLSAIVPVYNEEDALPSFLHACAQWDGVCEVIFVDGGSTDRTRELLQGHTVLTGAKGRGAQCRLGADHACGDALVFVHADSFLQDGAMQAISEALDAGCTWGCLTLQFDCNTPSMVFGAFASNARVRLSGIPFGDQVMFMTREAYDEVGGMPDMPLMEDYELSRRLRTLARPKQLPQKVRTSARRFQTGGTVRTMAQMRHLRHLYRTGTDVNELARMYYGSKE